jgi:hypothetical protein
LIPPEPSFGSYVSNVAHKPVTITGTLAVSRTKVQDNAMPSLDRLLIGRALVLLPSSLAVLWRHGHRNRCDFLCCRLLDAVACASRERGPIVSLLARKTRSRDIASTLRGGSRKRVRRLPGAFAETPAIYSRGRTLAAVLRLQGSLPVARFDPTERTISLALGRREAPAQQRGNW